MSVKIVVEGQAEWDLIANGIAITAAIEGGVGAVRIGIPVRLPDGRMMLSHPFPDVDLDWISTYASGLGVALAIEES